MKFDFQYLFKKFNKYFGYFGGNYIKEKISDLLIYGVGDYLKSEIRSRFMKDWKNKFILWSDKFESIEEMQKKVELDFIDNNSFIDQEINDLMIGLDEKI